MAKVLFWTPRVLSLAFIAFISLFALDVFSDPLEPMMFVGFLIHLLPSFALLALTIVAWRYPLVGALGFLGFTAWYVWATAFDVPFPWYMIIAGPTIILAVLYYFNWRQERRKIV